MGKIKFIVLSFFLLFSYTKKPSLTKELYLIYSADEANNNNLYLFNRTDTTIRKIKTITGAEPSFSIAPNNKSIIFPIATQDKRCLAIIDTAGNMINPCFKTMQGICYSRWSPDGNLVLFEAQTEKGMEIYVADTVGNIVKQITNNGANNRNPCWSPDGKQIVFVSAQFGVYEIMVTDFDIPSQITRLTNNKTPDKFPAWSPDGKWIAYNSYFEDGHAELHIVDPKGNTNRIVTKSHHLEINCWTKDSKKLILHDGNRLTFIDIADTAKKEIVDVPLNETIYQVLAL